jgi:hypothetical protein
MSGDQFVIEKKKLEKVWNGYKHLTLFIARARGCEQVGLVGFLIGWQFELF